AVGFIARVLEHLAVADDAVLIDDEHRALRDPLQADHVFVEDAVVADRLLVEIAQQRKVVALRVLERLEREESVDADAVDLRVSLVEPCERIAERAELLGAHAAEGGGKKGQHDGLAPLFAELY